MPVIQPVVDLIDVLVQHGLTHAVLSPGSRSAAITLAFARNPSVNTIVSIDERSAGFIALGLATEIRRPVAVVCTSGTAPYNFAPAVAEAFFSQIPLLIITADRPEEWVHQQDGQTIYQSGLFGKHVKKAFQFPCDTPHPDLLWYANRIANEIYLCADSGSQGPVHLNIPIREPFYPDENESFSPSPVNRLICSMNTQPMLSSTDWHRLQDEWEDTDKILIAGGQGRFSDELTSTLEQITEEWEIPILGDVTANLGNHPDFIGLQDVLLVPENYESLRPDLLVTFGQSFLSKKLKNFIRKNPPRTHWHIGTDSHLIDGFQSLTLRIPVHPGFFFQKMLEDIDFKRFVENRDQLAGGYKQNWLRAEFTAARVINECMSNHLTSLTDLTVVNNLVLKLPEDVLLHLGNSMPVRYANLLRRLGLRQPVWANRGTSGIDGCVSTAIGAALAGKGKTCLIVGDVSFLYDRNGFLITNFPSSLKILVLNNGGGNIFRIIDGPGKQLELETFFETRHHFTAQSTANDAGLDYFRIADVDELDTVMEKFIRSEQASLLEVFTDAETNSKLLTEIEQKFAAANPDY